MSNVLYVGKPDEDGYSRVVFLDGVGLVGGAWVEAVLVTPLICDPVVLDDATIQPHPVTITRVLMQGGRECLLAGEIAELRVDGEKVWPE